MRARFSFLNGARWLLRIASIAAIIALIVSLHFDTTLLLAVSMAILLGWLALDIAMSYR